MNIMILCIADSISTSGGASTTEEHVETGEQQPKAASSQEQEPEQKSPAAPIKETASWKSVQHNNLKNSLKPAREDQKSKSALINSQSLLSLFPYTPVARHETS